MTNTVLNEWRRRYIQALIDELSPGGAILEIGFAQGVAAEAIHARKPSSHTIVESDPEILQKAYAWAKKYPNVTVVAESWEKALPQLKVFDAIFLNDTERQTDLHPLQPMNQERLSLTASAAKEAYRELEQEFTKVKVQFSDKQIEEFYENVGKLNPEALSEFFLRLLENANITQEQYKKALEKYQIKPKEQKPTVVLASHFDTLCSLLKQCISQHMQKGSRFSSFVQGSKSLYEETRFFENIITDPTLDYREKMVTIAVPDACKYDALIMVVEKVV